MFTGIIESIGRIAAVDGGREDLRLVVEAPFAAELATGESVAVNGCCLTVLPAESAGLVTSFAADLSPETLARTTLGQVKPGQHVNLERAMRADARLSGHVVQGHVDGTTELLTSWPEGAGRRQRWSLPKAHARFVAEKGSVTIDGVSLTVAALGESWFEVALIPHTLVVTTLGERVPGDRGNLELDIAAKQAARLVELAGGSASGRSEPAWLADRPWLERYSTGTPWEPRVGYCRAVRTGSVVRVSGCAPVSRTEGGGTHASGDAEAQAERCCEILRDAVARLGGPDAVIVRTRIFVTDISRWEDIARAHARAFGAAPPVTTMVEVARLISPDMLVEIEADAEIPPRGRAPEGPDPR